MLIKFKFENFKSFEKYTVLNLIKDSKIKKNPEEIYKIGSVEVLKSALIYGANASGKSNIIKGINYLKQLVVFGKTTDSYRNYCLINQENKDKDSLLEVVFSKEGNIYSYAIGINFHKNKIIQEWAFKLYDKEKNDKKALLLFSKNYEDGKFTTELDTKNYTDKEKTIFLSGKYSEKENNTFLNYINRANNISQKSKLFDLTLIYNWFIEDLCINLPDKEFKYLYHQKNSNIISSILKNFDFPITDIKCQEVNADVFIKQVLPFNGKKEIENVFSKMKREKLKTLALLTNKSFHLFEMQGSKLKINDLKFIHKNDDQIFHIKDESKGMLKMLSLIDMLLDKNKTFIIDEIENSLHPLLIEEFLMKFKNTSLKTSKQIIFTTNITSLMDLKTFRQDSIWLIERGADELSSIYSLNAYEKRQDKKLSKNYIEGRYGAIPNISRL